MSEKGNHPVIGIHVAGHGKDKDSSGTGMGKYMIPGIHGQNVSPDDLNFIPSTCPADQQSKDTYGGTLFPSTPVLIQPAHNGSPNGVVLAMVRGFPDYNTTIPGNKNIFRQVADELAQAGNRLSGNVEGTNRKGPRKTENRGGVPVVKADDSQPYSPILDNLKPHFGETYQEIGRRWEQFKNIPTAETPFSNIINSNMLSQLPGKVLSLASTFKSLTSQQKRKIQSSVTPQMYNMIEANLLSEVDDPTDIDIGFNNRIHGETFANNMVDLLCQCTSYTDIMEVKQRLLYERDLHGLDKLPEIEFRVNTGFGEVGIIIDADGELRENVSSEVIASQQEFSNFLVGPENSYKATAQFYGTIDNNILTVNKMAYGNVVSGIENILDGDNIPETTYVTKFETGTGGIGTYLINNTTKTTPNTIITIISKQEQPQTASSSKNGGGGFPGMASGSNFFGDAARLVGEILPVLDPQGQSRIKKLLESITNDAGGPNVVIGQNLLLNGKQEVAKIGRFITGK